MADINLNINAKNNASETIKRIAGETKGLENQFKKLGTTIASAFAVREIYKFAKEAINATREFNKFARSIASVEMAVGKFGSNASWKSVLNNVNGQVDGLKKTANQYGVVINDVLSMRQELAEPLSFLDSNIINQLLPKLAAAGAMMGISTGQMANEIDAVIDGRLKEKSSVLVKSLGMDVSAANKMGGTQFISQLMTKLNSMESVFKEYAQSDEGKIAQFENTWSEFKIDLGTSLIPSLTTILEALKEPLEKFSTAVQSQGFQDFITKIGSNLAGGVGFVAEHPTESGIAATLLTVAAIVPNLDVRLRVILAEIAATVLGIGKVYDLMKNNEDPAYISGPGQKILGMGYKSPEEIPTADYIKNAKILFVSGRTYWTPGFPVHLKDFSDELSAAEKDVGYSAQNFSQAMDIIAESTQNTVDSLNESLKNTSYYEHLKKMGENIPHDTDHFFGTKFKETFDDSIKKYKKTTSQPIKVEIQLKADMPYQASLSLTDSNGTQNKKIAPRVSDGRLIRG